MRPAGGALPSFSFCLICANSRFVFAITISYDSTISFISCKLLSFSPLAISFCVVTRPSALLQSARCLEKARNSVAPSSRATLAFSLVVISLARMAFSLVIALLKSSSLSFANRSFSLAANKAVLHAGVAAIWHDFSAVFTAAPASNTFVEAVALAVSAELIFISKSSFAA